MTVKRPKIVVIIGPTSSGKSDLAVKIAKRFNGEIISADSRQVYRGLNIGSGKVPRDKISNFQLLISNKIRNPKFQIQKQPFFYKKIIHHLLDVASPKTTFTVVKYRKLAQKAIKDILRRGKIPIICGGTGFYIDSMLYNWKIPIVPPQLELRKHLTKKSIVELFKILSGLDPERAKIIDKQNKIRLVRALEIVMTTGIPTPKFQLFDNKNSDYDFFKIGMKIPEEELKKRINKRLTKRLKQGMVKEVERLRKQGVSWKRLDSFGLEYRWVSRYLREFVTKEEMVKILEREIWHYAKRQMTWFKRDKNTIWASSQKKVFLIVRGFLGREVQP